jgi:hypothetical protein
MISILKKHKILLIGIFIVYFTIVFLVSDFLNTFKAILIYSDTLNWSKFGFSFALSLIIGVLVSINGVLVWERYKERRACREGGFLASAGIVGGLITGVCPLCVGGLFPLIFGLLGISFSLGVLPFKGIEIQVLAIVLLVVSIRMLGKRRK